MKLTIVFLACFVPSQTLNSANELFSENQRELLDVWTSVTARADGELRSNGDTVTAYIRKKYGMAAPEWWGTAIRTGTVYNGQVESFDVDLLEGFVAAHWTKQGSIRFHGVDRVSFNGNTAYIAAGDRMATFDFSSVKKLLANEHYKVRPIVAAISNEQLFLAPNCPTDFGAPPVCYCVNTKTGKLLWHAQIETGHLPNGFSGSFYGTCSAFVCSRKYVGIWSAHDFDLCCQVFDRKSGKQMMCFTLRKKLRLSEE